MSSSRLERGNTPGVGHGTLVAIDSTADIVTARGRGRTLAAALGFTTADLTVIVSAISELAHNIVDYAARGEILLDRAQKDGRVGIVIISRDNGPGILDVSSALGRVAAPGQPAGLGLPGIRGLMDEFEIASKPRQGTTVTVRKWVS
jgi:serine/threonine-protein kinase RsbT